MELDSEGGQCHSFVLLIHLGDTRERSANSCLTGNWCSQDCTYVAFHHFTTKNRANQYKFKPTTLNVAKFSPKKNIKAKKSSGCQNTTPKEIKAGSPVQQQTSLPHPVRYPLPFVIFLSHACDSNALNF